MPFVERGLRQDNTYKFIPKALCPLLLPQCGVYRVYLRITEPFRQRIKLWAR
jgi:hypothetical protein